MLFTSLSVLVPVFFVIGLGYWAGRAKKFDADQVRGINELVMTYALPALLFVSAATTARRTLFADGTFLLALFSAFVGLYIVAALFSLLVLHRRLGEAALQANLVTFPSVAFFGIPIFRGLFGETSILSVALSGIAANLTLVPLTVILLEIHSGRGANVSAEIFPLVQQGILSSFKKPIVWAPLLGIVFALSGIELPPEVDKMFALIGSATGGTSLFLAGLIIAAYKFHVDAEVIGNVIVKMILQPAFMALLVFLLALPTPLGREAILLCAIPTSAFSAMLAARYQVYQTQTASTFILSTLTTVVTYPLWIWVTGG